GRGAAQARPGSSWAASAEPKNSAMEVRSDQSRSATMPASGPYVRPKEALREKNSPRPTVITNHSATATDDPNTSHDHAGWRRRGDQRNSNAMAASARPTPTGQAATSQARAQAGLPIEWLMARPNASTPTAAVRRAPTLTASASAKPYLCSAGRSFSTP